MRKRKITVDGQKKKTHEEMWELILKKQTEILNKEFNIVVNDQLFLNFIGKVPSNINDKCNVLKDCIDMGRTHGKEFLKPENLKQPPATVNQTQTKPVNQPKEEPKTVQQYKYKTHY